MAEEIGIVMKLYDETSPVLRSIAEHTKAFDKSLDELREGLAEYDKAQETMTRRSTELKKALEASNVKVKDARTAYKKLKDETSKGALDEAIEEQTQLKRELAETENALKANSRAYEDLYMAYITPDAREEKLLEHPELFVTPIVRNGREATVGYHPEIWQTWE